MTHVVERITVDRPTKERDYTETDGIWVIHEPTGAVTTTVQFAEGISAEGELLVRLGAGLGDMRITADGRKVTIYSGEPQSSIHASIGRLLAELIEMPYPNVGEAKGT